MFGGWIGRVFLITMILIRRGTEWNFVYIVEDVSSITGSFLLRLLCLGPLNGCSITKDGWRRVYGMEAANIREKERGSVMKRNVKVGRRKTGRRDEKLKPAQVRELLQRSAGLCEFENCAEPLFFDLVSLRACNAGEYAHIIPSSDNGPRGGGGEPVEYIADVSNRMHLCCKHHELIDANPERFPASELRRMKERHERCVMAFAAAMKKTSVTPIVFSVPIRGRITSVASKEVLDAIRADGRPASSNLPKELKVSSAAGYGSGQYWKETLRDVRLRVDLVLAEYSSNPAVEFGIFPLAPIPLIIMFAHYLGDKVPFRTYQLLRDKSRWSWSRKRPRNAFGSKLLRTGDLSLKRVAVAFSLSGEIGSNVAAKEKEEVPIYEIRALRVGVDCISLRTDLDAFRKTYLALLDEINDSVGGVPIDVYLYPAVPVSAAYEIGCRTMPMVAPRCHIMENLGNDNWVEVCCLE